MTAEKVAHKNEVKTSLGFDAEVWKRFQICCIERGKSQKQAMQEAMEIWMQPTPLALVAEYPDDFIEHLMGIVNNPRNETEKILRNLLKQVVDIRYISDVPQTRR